MDVLARNNVNVGGVADGPPMLFAHGFGCDQHMWSLVTPAFEATHKVILMDHVGAGASDLTAYDRAKYDTLDGYATDVLEICEAMDLTNVTFVGHSVSSMIGVLAANRAPERFAKLVLVAPSPRYVNDEGYVGGFESDEIAEVLTMLDSNYLGWSSQMAPVIMGNPDRPELGETLTDSFCRTDPEIARHFAHVTFNSDNRDDLAKVSVPALVLQCSSDALAPVTVGEFVAESIPEATLRVLDATGHCPNLSAPEETIDAMRDFLIGASA